MKSTMLHKSSRRFSSGVPVSARRCSDFSFFTDWVTCSPGFLMNCASSRIAERNANFRSEQAVLRRRASQRQTVLGLQLLHRLGDLRPGVLDELRLVQDSGAERKLPIGAGGSPAACQSAPDGARTSVASPTG